jgi:hypothetical protein
MYVIFPISQRAALDLRNRYANKGGFSAVVLKRACLMGGSISK